MNLKETLKQVFQSPYSQNQWISALTSIFGSSRVRFKVEPSPEALNQTQKQLANAVERVGEITLESGQELPFFEVELNPKIKVERNRVGINDLVKNLMLRGSTTEGALAVFYYPPEEEKSEWRFSFVSKEAGSEFFNELDQKETKPQRYTYVFGTDEGHKTAIDRFTTLSDSGLALDDLFEAFSVQSISDDFFREYQEVYLDFVQFLTGKRLQKRGGQYQEEQVQQPSNFLNLVFGNDEKAARDFCKKLIGRIVFLYFLQKKGWLGASIDNDNWDDGDPDFLKHLFEESGKADDFYNQWLSEVFFNTLNCSRPDNAFTMPDGWQVKMPYLNGGLFDDSNEPAYHKVIAFPPWVFEKLFDLLGRYNFTVYEDSPEDHIVAVDPEMLGHIFENLLEDNKEKGTYYTPKEIVHYMCQESLVEYLYTHLSKHSTKAYRRLGSSQTELFGNEGRKGQLAIEEEIQDDEPSLNRESLERFIKYQYLDEQVTNQQQVIEELMDQVKICDPAIGSGAFPMGLLQEIIQAKEALHEWRVEQNLEDRGDFDPVSIKLNLIQYCIYGVDIEQGAIDIARLRFWLSLVVDEKQPQLLPNLDYKIMQGNSLLESYGDIDLNIDNIQHDLIEEGSKQFTTTDKERLQELVADFYLPENVEQKPEIKEEIDGIIKNFIEGCIQDSQKKVDKEIEEINREMALINQQSQKQGKVQQKQETRKNTLKRQLEKATQERNKRQQQANELREMFKNQEFNFFLWHLWFQDIFKKGGFDIVIGNPPYVSTRTKDFDKSLISFYKSNFNLAIGQFDLYNLFFEKGDHILNNLGTLSFIVPKRLLSNENFRPLREFLQERLVIQRYLDAEMPFESVIVETNVVICKRFKKESVDIFSVKNGKFHYKVSIKYNSIIKFPFKIFPFILSQKEIELIEMINSSTNDIFGSYLTIKRGFECGANHPQISENGNDFLVKGGNIKKYKITTPTTKVTPDFNNPKVFKKPELFKTVPKLVTKFVSNTLDFAIDNYGFYNTNSVYNIHCELKECDLYFFLALGNSKVLNYWFFNTYVNDDNVFPHIQKNQLESLPVPYEYNSETLSLLGKIICFNYSKVIENVIDGLVFNYFFPDHMKARGIEIRHIVENELENLIAGKSYNNLSRKNKEKLIDNLIKNWSNSNNQVCDRISNFKMKSPDVLQPIIENIYEY